MPSLKDVLEATLAEAEFDLGEREMTRHGPSHDLERTAR